MEAWGTVDVGVRRSMISKDLSELKQRTEDCGGAKFL